MKRLLILSFALAVLSSCCTTATNDRLEAIVPLPNKMVAKCGTFDVKGRTISIDAQADDRTLAALNEFAARLAAATEGQNEVVVTETLPADGFRFKFNPDITEEGYKLTIEKEAVTAEASSFPGFFYAVQTIKQLLPAAIYGSAAAPEADWTLPCAAIDDAPRFSYRGMHFDVSRHFFDIDEVKRYIDIMAVNKLNTLHWHLTDDQGWRIEIKKYPRLTSVGGWRSGTCVKKDFDSSDGIPHGGFYTQEQIREVVEYAAAQAITVIPEIDLPGHMVAAITAYPELGCTGGPYEVWKRWGVSDDVLCVGKEKTFEFIEDVLTEVMELFPSEYIHIGGDECPKVRWESCPHCQARIRALGLKADDKFSAEQHLQSYVTRRVEKFLREHGRRVIGWDEILEGEISPSAVVMSWRGSEGGIEAARKGHDVIMTPNSHFYLDYYQSLDTDREPFGIGGYVPVDRVYSYDPMDQLTPEQGAHILGVQANMWTEYVVEPWHLEYMILPRMAALSEVQWCQPEVRDYDRFTSNFRQQEIYDVMGYTYAKHIFGITGTSKLVPEKNAIEVTLSTSGHTPIYYTLDGSEPTAESTLYTKPVLIDHSCVLKAAALREGIETPLYIRDFEFTKTTGHAATLNSNPTPKYTYNAHCAFTDGHHGSARYTDTEWVGFLKEPMDLTIDMKGAGEYSSVTVEATVDNGEWIFPPAEITVSVSNDNENFEQVGSLAISVEQQDVKDGVQTYTVEFPATDARWLRIVANTVESIPAWHGAAGHQAHLFIGEISAE